MAGRCFPAAWTGYGVLVVLAVVVVLLDPILAPHYHSIFFTDSLAAVQSGIFFGQLPLILVHE